MAWYDATKLEMDQINEYKVFQDHGEAQDDPKSRKVSNAPNGYQKIRSTSSLLSNMMADTRPDWLLEDISLQIPLKASTLALSPSDPLDWLYS